MATQPYSHSTAAAVHPSEAGNYAADLNAPGSLRRDVGAQVFIWLAWAGAAAFWAMGMTAFFGILTAIGSNPQAPQGGADVGGVGWFMMTVVGVSILGIAMMYGAVRYSSRDKSKDPMTERATAALYDTIADQGGEDLTTRSPEAHSTTERDAYRASQGDLR